MIYLGADKHGLKVITIVKDFLKENNYDYINIGIEKEGEDIRLQDLIPKAASHIIKSPENRAILVCGTGVGVAVGANKIKGIRASLATDKTIAEWSVVYDNCNVLCLSGWKADITLIENIVDAYLKAKYDGSEKRLKMMEAFDTWR
jgi:ribose 5-phosphate isomerase B